MQYDNTILILLMSLLWTMSSNAQSLSIKNALYRNKCNIEIKYSEGKDQSFYLIGREMKLLKKNKGEITIRFYFDRVYQEIETSKETIPEVLFSKPWFRNMKLEWSNLNGTIYEIKINPKLLDDEYILYLSPLLAQV